MRELEGGIGNLHDDIFGTRRECELPDGEEKTRVGLEENMGDDMIVFEATESGGEKLLEGERPKGVLQKVGSDWLLCVKEFEKSVEARAERNIRRNCGRNIFECGRDSRIDIARLLQEVAELLEDRRVRIKLRWTIGWVGHGVLPSLARL